MTVELVERTLVDRRRGMLGWCTGLAVYIAIVLAFFPTVRDSPSYAALADEYPDALKDIFGGSAGFELSTGPGFANVQLFTLVLPVLFVAVSISAGASFGADQERGFTAIVLSNAVRRSQVVAAHTVALAATVMSLAFVVTVAILTLDRFVGLEIGFGRLLAAVAGLALLSMFHGLVALAASAWTGHRATASGVAAMAFAFGYLITVLAGLVDRAGALRHVSPYHHGVGVNHLLGTGSIGNLVALSTGCCVLYLLTRTLFERRDVS